MAIIIVSQSNNIYSFGENTLGELGLGHLKHQSTPQLLKLGQPISISQISCGLSHTIMLTNTNDVMVFGSNNYGQLGLDRNDWQHTQYSQYSQTRIPDSNYNYRFVPQLLPNIKAKLLPNVVFVQWDHQHHHLFPTKFHNMVITFLLINRYYNKNYNLGIPKFVRFEIIKFCY